MSKRIDISGEIFGRWKVLGIAESDRRGELLWHCQCLCGTKSIIHGSSLRSGNSSSCGCYRSENPHRKTHGASLTQEYQVWKAMIRRCENKNVVEYKDYGGRGIGVCPQWRNSFEKFIEDMGERPAGRTIERKNNDGNYELDNCRWATKRDQANNTRANRVLTICGKKKTMSQWSRAYGKKVGTIWKRLTLGWTEEDAIKTP